MTLPCKPCSLARIALHACMLPVQMCADGGTLSEAALQQLAESAYSGAVRLEGGYAGWSEVNEPATCCCLDISVEVERIREWGSLSFIFALLVFMPTSATRKHPVHLRSCDLFAAGPVAVAVVSLCYENPMSNASPERVM